MQVSVLVLVFDLDTHTNRNSCCTSDPDWDLIPWPPSWESVLFTAWLSLTSEEMRRPQCYTPLQVFLNVDKDVTKEKNFDVHSCSGQLDFRFCAISRFSRFFVASQPAKQPLCCTIHLFEMGWVWIFRKKELHWPLWHHKGFITSVFECTLSEKFSKQKQHK